MIALLEGSRNFLKNVILKVDFLGELKLSQQAVDSFKRVISDDFPEVEPREQISVQMTMDQSQRTTREKRTKVFFYHNIASKNSISLEPDAIVIDIKKYTNYDEFKRLVQKIIQNLETENPSVKVSRVGLRYVNQITLSEGHPLEWTGFIKEPLISSINFVEKQNELSRLIGIIELNRSEYSIKFQYGLFNSEYPNPIAKKEFLLDYDCYSRNETHLSSVLGQVDTYHNAIKELFRYSILDDLEKVTEGGSNVR